MPPGLLAASRLCQLLWTYARWPEPGDDGRARLSPAEFRRVMKAIADSTKHRDVEFLMLGTGCRENVVNKSLTVLQREQLAFAQARKLESDDGPILVAGWTDLFRLVVDGGQPVESLLFDEAHPTMGYSRVLADALVKRLTRWVLAR